MKQYFKAKDGTEIFKIVIEKAILKRESARHECIVLQNINRPNTLPIVISMATFNKKWQKVK